MNGIFTVKIDANYRTNEQLKALIAGIDSMINFLNQQALANVGNVGMAEYELDTGQTKIRKKFNSVSSVIAAIKEYEALRQMYINKLNRTTGRYQLMGAENFNKRCR
jgi:hypothetical protein